MPSQSLRRLGQALSYHAQTASLLFLTLQQPWVLYLILPLLAQLALLLAMLLGPSLFLCI